MPKIFERQFEGKYQPKRIDEDLWFKQQQKMLLWMANTDYGRDLLCINKRFPKIIGFRKNCVTGLLDIKKYRVQYVSDFRVGSKWANVIRYRWKEFQEYAQVYYAQLNPLQFRMPIFNPVAPVPGFAYVVDTVYPDANPETTTVDGYLRNTSSSTWATCRGASSADNGATDDSVTYLTRVGILGSGNFDIIRGMTLFDAADEIPDTNNIDSAIYSLYVNSVLDEDNDSEAFIGVVTCTPASNTGMVADDFDQFTTTEQHATGQRKDITNITTGVYTDWTLDATGLGNISKTGITKFATREGHDILDIPFVGSNANNQISASAADTAGTSQDPKLEVTHSAAVPSIASFARYIEQMFPYKKSVIAY